jgi:hypothetical protein
MGTLIKVFHSLDRLSNLLCAKGIPVTAGVAAALFSRVCVGVTFNTVEPPTVVWVMGADVITADCSPFAPKVPGR